MLIKNLFIIISLITLLFISACKSKESFNYLCQENDDGKNPQKRSVVKLINDEKIVNRMDECYNNILVEYYCDKGKISSVNINCESQGSRCYAGACQKIAAKVNSLK